MITSRLEQEVILGLLEHAAGTIDQTGEGQTLGSQERTRISVGEIRDRLQEVMIKTIDVS
jgi:hypothetical protein